MSPSLVPSALSVAALIITRLLYLHILALPLSWAWDAAERGDPFLDFRFRQILTISCLQNESSPWTCPENSKCLPAPVLGALTNLCVCDENYVNPDPYQYGENITILYDEEEEGANGDGGGEGLGDTIVLGHDHDPEADSSIEYEDEDGPAPRCVAREDATMTVTVPATDSEEAHTETESIISDSDPRWAILRVACNRELTTHPETICPRNSECRNGKDCVCFDGWIGDPAREYRECKGGAGRVPVPGKVSTVAVGVFVIVLLGYWG